LRRRRRRRSKGVLWLTRELWLRWFEGQLRRILPFSSCCHWLTSWCGFILVLIIVTGIYRKIEENEENDEQRIAHF